MPCPTVLEARSPTARCGQGLAPAGAPGGGPAGLQLPVPPAVGGGPWLSAASLSLCLHLHVTFSGHVRRCPNLLLLTRTLVPGLGSPPDPVWPRLSLITSAKTGTGV